MGAWPLLPSDGISYVGFGEGMEKLHNLEIQTEMQRVLPHLLVHPSGESNSNSEEAEVTREQPCHAVPTPALACSPNSLDSLGKACCGTKLVPTILTGILKFQI